jgi:periplasmic divalent cation tolerance protein
MKCIGRISCIALFRAFPYDGFPSIDPGNPNHKFYMTDKRLVLTTAGSREEAGKIAHALVKRRLAACINIVPTESVYRWKGQVEESAECLLLIKTTAAAFDGLRDTLEELHSYELPECIAVVIDEGSGRYLNWIQESVAKE